MGSFSVGFEFILYGIIKKHGVMNKLLLIWGSVIVAVSVFLSIQSCDSDDTEDSSATVAESNCKIIKP